MTRLQMRSQDRQADVWKASCPPGGLHHSPGASPGASLPCSRGMKVPAAAAPRTDEVPGRLAPPRDASVGGFPTSSSRAGSSLCCGILCQMPRDAAPVARGQPGCVCSTASLPHSPLVSPSLSSLQSNLLNSPCPRAWSVHFHDVSSLCPRATHRGSPPLRRSRGGSRLCQESRGEGRLLTSGFLQYQSWRRVTQRADCWESMSGEERAGSQGNAGNPEPERTVGWVEEQASMGYVGIEMLKTGGSALWTTQS